MKILLGWELGGALGHISKLLPVARCLRRRGHDVLFAVKNVSTASQLLDDEGFDYVQSPHAPTEKIRSREPASFGDILAEAGFGNTETLTGLMRAWQSLFGIFRPDVLVAQYAPSAQIAARLAGVPCLALNMGFEAPHPVSPFPCFRPWLKVTRQQLLKREESLLGNINMMCARQGAPPYHTLQEALESDVNLLATFPELDHYQGRSNGRYIGPLFVIDDGIEMSWAEGDAPRIFAYLRPVRGIRAALDVLKERGANVIAFIPGVDERFFTSYSNKQLQICTSKVKLSSLLPEMDLAVTHANHGTLAAALLAGVPMLSIPTTIEQLMLSRNLERLGIGIGIRRDRIADEFSPALERLLSDRTFRDNAKRLAKKYAGYDLNRVIERISSTVERLPEWAKRRTAEQSLKRISDGKFI